MCIRGFISQSVSQRRGREGGRQPQSTSEIETNHQTLLYMATALKTERAGDRKLVPSFLFVSNVVRGFSLLTRHDAIGSNVDRVNINWLLNQLLTRFVSQIVALGMVT